MKRLIVVLGVLGTSISAIMVRFSTAPSMILVLYRVVLTLVLMLPSVLRHRKEWLALSQKEGLLCIASGAFLGLHFVTYFESVRQTSIAASVVLADTEVFFVALGSILFLHQKLTKKAWMAIILTFLGSVVVAFANTGEGTQMYGNLLALMSALFMTSTAT